MNIRSIISPHWVRSVWSVAIHPPIHFFPFSRAVRSYGLRDFLRDARAAGPVAVVAFIQGMTCASIAGLPIEYGILSAIVAAIMGGVFSGSRLLVIGPTNAIAILVFSTLAASDFSLTEKAVAMPALLLMTGLILIAASWFRIASLTQYVSRSVVTAYLTGAAGMIAITQLKYALGLNIEETGILLQNLFETVRQLPSTHLPSLVVALSTGLVFVLFHFRVRAVPASVAAFLAGSGAALIAHSLGYTLVPVAVVSPDLLPSGEFAISFDLISLLSRVALAIALMSFLETSVIGKSNAARTGVRFDGNQQMFAIGMANLTAAFSSGMPVSGSRTRSQLNLQLGAVTPVAAVLSGVFCVVIFILVRPFVIDLTRPVLATVAIGITMTLVDRDAFRVILRSTPSDVLVLTVTLLSCLFFPLDAALYLGAGLSIVFFLKKVGVPELVEYAFTEDGHLAEIARRDRRSEPDISIVHVEGDLFFGAAELFLDQARRVFEDPNLKVIILRMKNAHHLDATCAMAIRELLEFAKKSDRHIIVSGAHRQIFRVFRNSGLLDLLGRKNFFMEVPSNPTVSTRNALKRAQTLLGQQKANIRIYVDPAKQNAKAAP
ncbi:MAG: SulP family inorganic anion transporter [Opitutaceae bacterium]